MCSARRRAGAVVLAALLGIVFLFSGCSAKTLPSEPTTEDFFDAPRVDRTSAEPSVPSKQAELLPGVIASVFSYSGEYVEDGSNGPVEDIVAVRLENHSDTHYQYIDFSLDVGGEVCTFTATTLFAGGVMTVLSNEKTPYSGDLIDDFSLLGAGPFTEPPSVHIDELEITCADGFINVRNISGNTLENVYVYYKNLSDDGWLGGITYRVSFGELEPGALIQKKAADMRGDPEQVVFATFTEE